MNKDNAKDYLPLVQALADGKVIQLWNSGVRDIDKWRDVGELATLSRAASEYRIKPEPREIWVNRFPSGQDGKFHYSSIGLAKMADVSGLATQACYREVIE